MMKWLMAAATSVIWCVLPSVASGQRNELDMEVRPFSGSLTYLWRGWGLGAGGGIDVLNRTLVPDTEEERFAALEPLLYMQVLRRWRASQRFEFDVGTRAGVGDVRDCFASDCWPGTYVGVYVAPMWGGRRFKVGPRLLAGVSHYGSHDDRFLYLEILTARVALIR